MFCYNCGQKNDDESDFCENCGTNIRHSSEPRRIDAIKIKTKDFFLLLGNQISKIKDVPPLKVLGSIFLALILLGGAFAAEHFYKSYQQTQLTIQQTTKQLQETQAKLSDIASTTSQRLTDQEKALGQKDGQIAKLEGDLKGTTRSNVSSGSVGGNALASLSPSVVKIICYSDRFGDNLQLGSGVLYHSAEADPASYFVQTNQHVVQTDDGSPSECAIAVYPNYRNTANYLVYKTSGYKTYSYGVDFAYIVPQITSTENAGTMNQLATYAKNLTSATYCKSTSIGDHISILGYPGVGGSSLTATDGIISGFETDEGTRFIKTSAKIEHGNSGGVAIKDSGCILGIPTFVETGKAESIGRILDLADLFSN
jgi:hypothetical protein